MNPVINDLAACLNVGDWARRKWRQRGSVPHRWRLPIMELAAERGIPLTTADMEWPPKMASREAA
jgi:hypothetical protein